MKLPVLPQDKANHVVYGAVIALVATYVAVLFKAPCPALVGLISAAVFAVAKELHDRLSGTGTADQLDAEATYFGGVLVTLAAVATQ
jgi:hypothetical protein